MEIRNPGERAPRPCPPRLLCVASSGVVSLLHTLGAFQLIHDINEIIPRSLGEHLLSSSALLRITGLDDELCDAGALHSVYGTEFFQCAIAGPLGDMSSRARVMSIAGERAERLANLFCALDRPTCFLDMVTRPFMAAGAFISLPLRKQPGCAVRVSVEDFHSLLLLEAANLLDQGGPILSKVSTLPPHAPLYAAVFRVWSSTFTIPSSSFSSNSSCALNRAPAPVLPASFPPQLPTPPPTSFCCPWGEHRRWWWRLPLRTVELPSPPPFSPTLELPGCFLLDGPLGGPLCPPHLWPAVFIPPSPFHATLPPQTVGPQEPCPRPLLTALERGEAVRVGEGRSSNSIPGRSVSATELFMAMDEGRGSSGGARESLAKELVALLSVQGFLRIDLEEDDSHTVDDGFAKAEEFFARLPVDKRRAMWGSGPGKKHAGWRGEGSRELFAVRDDEVVEGEGGLLPIGAADDSAGANAGGANAAAAAAAGGGTASPVVSNDSSLWPCTPWRALFTLQRRVARALFELLAVGVGVDLTQDHKIALFGGELGGPKGGSRRHHNSHPDSNQEEEEGEQQQQGPLEEGCCDVMRVYRYLRPANVPPPGMRFAATSAHCDVGLLTVSPLSTLPGLVILDPSGRRWVDVESGGGEVGGSGSGSGSGGTHSTLPSTRLGGEKHTRSLICFLGEAGARLLAQGSAPSLLRAPVHFVMERGGGAVRYSAPFFLRASSTALLAPGLTNTAFLQSLALRPWVRLRGKDRSPTEWASDF